ncbi:conserved hypothetical protein [Leishmania mexicana MHOM/GT/2001/U1103]|uniref:Uncharacterized protein n=2 Tax=Leishmania TaxID=38568 RepID=E9AYQ8_LEIMU|nr:conserved hypothetical protein [Leishmania mexicana MHOM/GT/2001/U1103]CBZ28101.1 conserved hypothetical protein [Leishmania mexicana MHOM/GT/2001/U1103]
MFKWLCPGPFGTGLGRRLHCRYVVPCFLACSALSRASVNASRPCYSETSLSHLASLCTSSQIRPTITQRHTYVLVVIMPRAHQKVEADSSIFSHIVEQGWVAFIILGALMIGLRLYNVKQRRNQRKLLREELMAEMGYRSKASRKGD